MSDTARFEEMSPARLATLSDDELLEHVQRQTFRFFWEAGHPLSGLAPDRRPAGKGQGSDLVTTGGSGFALMALVVAIERGWITREQGLERLSAMLDVLVRATCYHGALPHFFDGRTGATLPFSRKDDGGDLVETSFLCMGLLTARQYFDRDTPAEARVRNLIIVAVGGCRVGLVRARRPRRALLALESQQRLGHRAGDPRLERVPDHLRARRRRAALSHRRPRLSSWLRQRAGFPQRQAAGRASSCRSGRLSADRSSSRTTPSAASIRGVSRTATRTTGSRT